VGQREVITLSAVKSQLIAAEVAVGNLGHLLVQGVVEEEVVSWWRAHEVIITGQGCVTLESVVAIKTSLAASSTVGRSAVCGITTKTELLSDWVTVESDTQGCKKDSQIVTDTIDILLSIDKLIEGCDTVVRQEVVVGCRVQSRAWTTDIVLSWRNVVMGFISLGWHQIVVAREYTWKTILRPQYGYFALNGAAPVWLGLYGQVAAEPGWV